MITGPLSKPHNAAYSEYLALTPIESRWRKRLTFETDELTGRPTLANAHVIDWMQCQLGTIKAKMAMLEVACDAELDELLRDLFI